MKRSILDPFSIRSRSLVAG